MRTVVLVGFSTAGKSTILRHFKKILGTCIEVIDSDERISREFGGHIYLLYSKLVVGGNQKIATDFVEKRERDILDEIQPSNKSRLIAFGPAVPDRERQWSDFIKRVHPVVFYLELSAREVREGLGRRRDKHLTDGLQSLPAFGSWDERVTTRFDKVSNKWVLIDDEKVILDNIYENMKGLIPIYKKAADLSGGTYSARKLQKDLEYRQVFYEAVTTALLR